MITIIVADAFFRVVIQEVPVMMGDVQETRIAHILTPVLVAWILVSVPGVHVAVVLVDAQEALNGPKGKWMTGICILYVFSCIIIIYDNNMPLL
jgi:hypothetical protein